MRDLYLLGLAILMSLLMVMSWDRTAHAIYNCVDQEYVHAYAKKHGWALIDWEIPLYQTPNEVYLTERGNRIVIYGERDHLVCVFDDFLLHPQSRTPGMAYVS